MVDVGLIRPGINHGDVWAMQLVWIGSRLLERPVKRVLRSVLTSKDTPMKKAAQALRSSF